MTTDEKLKLYLRVTSLDLLNQSVRMVHHDDREEWVLFRGFRHDVLGNPDVVFARPEDPYRCEIGYVTCFPDLLGK